MLSTPRRYEPLGAGEKLVRTPRIALDPVPSATSLDGNGVPNGAILTGANRNDVTQLLLLLVDAGTAFEGGNCALTLLLFIVLLALVDEGFAAREHEVHQEPRRMIRDGYEPVLTKSRWCLLQRQENLTDKQLREAFFRALLPHP